MNRFDLFVGPDQLYHFSYADTQCEKSVRGSPQERVRGVQPHILHWWSNQL